ncbi:leukocyte elastase inhibitor-like isoform X2 [Engystomops pustulosus]|uniref:leukocyte elastase inhibitor-like isoform X2 n=1 Tax=Engystomops pustulosus TaxID=76066 RepID=UPI003AFADBB5
MDIYTSNNQFAVDVLRQICGTDVGQNVVFAPLSIMTALSMVYLGARGNTAAEMGKALHFSDVKEVHSSCKNLLNDLVTIEGDYVLMNVNKLFGEKTFRFLPTFLNDTRNLYDASLEQLDFLNDPETSRKYINEWITQQTRAKIQELLPDQSISENTVLVLANTLYFSANWTKPFNQKKTSKAPFTRMSVEKEISLEKLNKWMSNSGMKMMNILVRLPKFRVEKSFSMKNILSSLGILDAFSQTKANFSGMTKQSDVFLSEVHHKTFLEINEKGTEAASTTASVMSVRSFPADEFKADRPFYYFIKHKSGCIVLCGVVYNP